MGDHQIAKFVKVFSLESFLLYSTSSHNTKEPYFWWDVHVVLRKFAVFSGSFNRKLIESIRQVLSL